MVLAAPKRRVQATEAMNSWIQDELEDLATQLGMSEIPMANPDFNFFDYTKAVMRKRGYAGLTLEEKTNETLQRLLFDMERGGPGPLLRQYDGRTPFDAYFKMAVNRRALTELRDDKAERSRLPSVNIKPSGKDEVTPGVSEETLGDNRVTGPNDEYLDQTVNNMLGYLSRERYGDILAVIFRLMTPEPLGSGMDQGEVVQYLNTNQVPSPTGETKWSPGMVNNYVRKIRDTMSRYIEDENKGEGGEGTLKKLMTKEKPPAPPKPAGVAYWKVDGDENNKLPIQRVLRRGKPKLRSTDPDTNSAILLEDGRQLKVPTSQIEFPN